MKKTLIFITFGFVFGFVYSQQSIIDSLKINVTQTQDERHRLELLFQICLKMIDNGDQNNEEVLYLGKTLDLAKKLGNTEITIKTAKYFSEYYLTNENFKQAEYYGLMSNQLSKEKKLKEEIIKTYLLSGRVYNHFDMYNKAIINYKKAVDAYNDLNAGEKKRTLQTLSTIYANLSIVYRNIHKDSLADYYSLQSSKIADKTNDYMRKSNMYATIAWTYEYLNNYEQAVKYFKLGLKDSAKIKLKIYNIANHHGLGHVYGKWGKYDLALHHDSIALSYFIRTKNRLFTQAVLRNMSDVFLAQNKPDLAMEYVKKALVISFEIKTKKSIIDNKITMSKIYIQKKDYAKAKLILNELTKDTAYSKYLHLRHKPPIYEILAQVEAFQKNWKKALDYTNLYIDRNRQIVRRKLKHLSGIEAKYQNEKKEKELILKKQEVKTQKMEKQRFMLFSIILLFISALLFLAFRFYYTRYKRNKKELTRTIFEIKKIKKRFFVSQDIASNNNQHFTQKDFHKFLMNKFGIEKIEVIDVWESIANGVGRKEYAEKMKISENTIKVWRKELYKKLKKATFSNTDERYSDYKAVVEYYNSLRWYESLLSSMTK